MATITKLLVTTFGNVSLSHTHPLGVGCDSGAPLALFPSSIFARALSGYDPNRRMIVVLAAFFDDSGTHASSPVVSMGGLLGTEKQWNAFGNAWANLLDNPMPGKPPLKQFHLSACQSARGEFKTYNSIERDHAIYQFNRVILDLGLVTLASAVNKVAWDELITGDVALELGNPRPEEFCFYKCLESVCGTIRLRKPGQKVLIAFDQGTRPGLENYARFYMSKRKEYPEISGIGFAKVSEVLALQGADMIATQTYQYAQAWMKDRENPAVDPRFREYIHRDLSGGVIFDREHIEEMVARVRNGLPH